MKSVQAEGLRTLRAAIYARKSTDDSDRNAENKSVTRQIENAKAYATQNNWTVDPDAIFCDDGISGAEYVNRPGLARLMASLKQFDVLVLSESSRLGRDMTRNAAFVVNIIESGKRIFYYLTGEEEKADTPEQKIMLTLRSYASEVERIKAGQRSRDALERKAKAGYNAGGLVYGYDNVAVYTGDKEKKKSHTEFKVNQRQADVIRRMFKMYAAGYGPRSIAKALNGDPTYAALSRQFFSNERPPKPKVGKRGTESWAPTAIRDMLRNERYAGVLIYGETAKRYRMGTKQRTRQVDPERIIRIERPALRIVPSDLWDAVQKRIAAERLAYLQTPHGRARGRRDSPYLLSGLVKCGGCSASMVMSSQPHGTGPTRRNVRCYVCNYRSQRGSTACTNSLRPREDVLTRAVLAGIGDMLKPEVLQAAVREAMRRHRERTKSAQASPATTRRELAKAEQERDRLVDAIRLVGGGKLESLVPKLTECEARIETLRRDLQEVERPAVVDALGERRFERRLAELAQGWQGWIGKHPALARQALRAMLVGQIQLIPEQGGYRLKGVSRLGALFEQGAADRALMASPQGSATCPTVAITGRSWRLPGALRVPRTWRATTASSQPAA